MIGQKGPINLFIKSQEKRGGSQHCLVGHSDTGGCRYANTCVVTLSFNIIVFELF